MLNEFDLITHHFEGEIDIYPIADVHLGAMEQDEASWQAFVQNVMQQDAAYLILAGDLLNNSVRGTRFANPFDERYRPRDAKRLMVDYLRPLRDRILCVVTGNHERRTYRDDDQDLTYDICSKLDIEHLYRENVAFMSVGIGHKSATEERPRYAYTFAVTHGAGGGIYTGATVNRNERWGNVVDGLDCLVVGHTHKGTVSKPSKIVIDARNGNITMKHYTVISCVSWLAYGGYAARGMMLPAAHSDPQRIHLKGTGANGKRIITTW